MADVIGYLKDLVIDQPKEYWIDEPKRYFIQGPEDVGYNAFRMAREQLGAPMSEFTQADAAKHAAWQGELTKRLMERTGLPRSVSGRIANVGGVGKELLDVIGSTALGFIDAKKEGKSVLDSAKNAFSEGGSTALNALMDLRSNDYGARRLPLEGDIAQNAVNAASQGTTNPLRSILDKRLYYRD